MCKLYLAFLACCLSAIPAFAQYRAVQSTSGGIAGSASYAVRMTAGEPIQGATLTSASDTLITGFYFLQPPPFIDRLGPVILFGEIGGVPITPLSNTPPPQVVQPADQSVSFSTQITDRGSGVRDATLYHRQGGEPTFSSVPMIPDENTFVAVIEGNVVGSRGLEYYIEATDSLDNISRSPAIGAYAIQVRFETPGLQRNFSGDSTLAGYRLIAIPLQPSNPSSSVILDDLGTYNNRLWRLWSLKTNYADFEGEDQYQELTGGATFAPGSAFWLISRNDWTLQTGAATSISTVEPFTMSLHAGWNFIGNPYDFSIPIENISLSTDGMPDVRQYLRGWQNASSLEPFQGYAIDAGENNNVILTIDPNPGSSGKQASSKYAAASEYEWAIQIQAFSGDLSDTENILAVHRNANRDWDVLDRPEPPVIGDYVSVSFPHEEWGKIHDRYEADVRPAPVTGDQWHMDVATGTPRTVMLSFKGIEDIPPRYRIQILDERNKTIQELRDRDTYTLRSEGSGKPYKLTLLVGDSGYIDERTEEHDLVPEKYELDQNYPNPFNPTTSIRYSVSTQSIVTLEVYNLLGQVVKTLVNNELKETGYHVSSWDARADDGSPVSSGMYLYKLTAIPSNATTSFPVVLTRKMMLIK